MVQRFNVLQNVFGRDEYEMSLNENGYWVKWKDVAPILADALKPSTNDAMVSASQISQRRYGVRFANFCRSR